MRVELEDAAKDVQNHPEKYDLGDRGHYSRKKRQCNKSSGGCFKFLSCLVLALLIVAVIAWLTVWFVVAPVVTTVDALPEKIATQLNFYNLDEAEIKNYTVEDKQTILSSLDNLPDWLAKYLWEKMAGQAKEELADLDFKEIVASDDFKDSINTDTVSINWNSLDKNTGELSDYYKQELDEQGFEYRESITDYDINLDFWKEGIFGSMSFKEERDKDKKSMVDIIINYFQE